jgi:cytochrome d ubiquinol oxidase subunit II
VSIFAMHGSIYLYLKTEGELQKRLQPLMWKTFGFFLVMYMLTTMYTMAARPEALNLLKEQPIAWIVPVLNVLAIANIPRAIYLGKPGYAFLSSCATIVALNFLLGVALFPNLIVSSIDPAYSLTIYNAASSQKTLSIMRTIAFLGMPFVVAYTVVIYWVFRGKVELGKFSY